MSGDKNLQKKDGNIVCGWPGKSSFCDTRLSSRQFSKFRLFVPPSLPQQQQNMISQLRANLLQLNKDHQLVKREKSDLRREHTYALQQLEQKVKSLTDVKETLGGEVGILD